MERKVTVFYTPTFEKRFRKLPVAVKRNAAAKERIFRANPFELKLKTHKLVGKMKGYWSFSIDYQYRVVFRFIEDNKILFLDIGTHAIYK